MQLKSIPLLLGVSFIIFSGCKKDGSVVSSSTNAENQVSSSAKHSKHHIHGHVTIVWTYTALPAPGTRTGTAVAHGALETSGTSTMHTNVSGDVLNCSQTLVTSAGTLTMLSTCHLSTNDGIWHIVSGTGDYANLEGNGTLVMSFPGPGVVGESFTGKIKQHDHDGEEEDDDED